MGQVLSLNTCISGGSVIRVMNTDGTFDIFEFPCICAEVMLKYPGFLVVHCTPVNKHSLGQRSKITIVLPDQPLLPGQPYMLYPVPEKYKRSLSRSKSFAMVKSKLDGSSGAKVTIAERRKGRRKALNMIFTRLNLATFVAYNLNSPEKPLEVDTGKKGDGEEDTTTTQNHVHHHWAPLLSPVPESPLGFHTIAESPAGLYKMDGVPRTPLAVGARPQQAKFTQSTSRLSSSSAAAK